MKDGFTIGTVNIDTKLGVGFIKKAQYVGDGPNTETLISVTLPWVQ